ncbi:MAG: thioredoxin family protein [Verrucomicrobiales bacterium]|nr:thioredoxin family protein [Verrucomicrobiales bacterium]
MNAVFQTTLKKTPVYLAVLTLFLHFATAFCQGINPYDSLSGLADQSQPASAVTAELVSNATTVVPGQKFYMALKFTHQEGWHTYWKQSGNIELAPDLNWKLPEGFESGDTLFTTPKRLEKVDWEGTKVTNYGYGDVNYLILEVSTPKELPPGEEYEFSVEANWQHCDDKNCSRGAGTFSLNLPVTEKAVQSSEAANIEDALKKVPQPTSAWEVAAVDRGLHYELVLTPGENANSSLKDLYFFSDDTKTNGASIQQFEKRENGTYVLTATKNPDLLSEMPTERLSGILYSASGFHKSAPSAGAIAIAPEIGIDMTSASSSNLAVLLGLAFVGGLILNLMPCVFPVIGLKIMGFVNQAGEDRKKITLHGLVFALGVLISFWVLSGLFFLLRSQGEQIGWGFQLQNPWFVFSLILVMFVLALNMAGVFEIGMSATGVGGKLANKNGLSGTFFSGVLATVVATPCSAPFLGTALGAVISMPIVPFFAIFTSIALGLSFPYIILSLFPSLVERLPRPGPWMESFKQGMSFLLFGTAGYLIWVYSGLVPDDHSLRAIIGLSVIALGLWVYGRWHLPTKPKKIRFIALGLTALFVFGGTIMGKPAPEGLKWEVWSPARVAELRDEGKPVYIDFTARWCATCQTNKASYQSDTVKKAIREKGIVLLKADWTRPDAQIEKAINQYGKGAIPVNILYLPKEDTPKILPELLSSSTVLNYISKVP